MIGLTKYSYLLCICCCYNKQEPDGGTMKGLAFAYDPDGYWIEIVPRGGLDFGDAKLDSK
jgi:hypothetical protein